MVKVVKIGEIVKAVKAAEKRGKDGIIIYNNKERAEQWLTAECIPQSINKERAEQ